MLLDSCPTRSAITVSILISGAGVSDAGSSSSILSSNSKGGMFAVPPHEIGYHGVDVNFWGRVRA